MRNESSTALRVVAPAPKQLNVNEVAEKFLYYANKLAIKSGKPGFELDQENEQTIEALLLYFSNSPKFLELDFVKKPRLEKGVAILGNVGSGKSLIMEAFSLCRLEGNSFNFQFVPEVVEKYNTAGSSGIKYLAEGCVKVPQGGGERLKLHACLDDCGTEPIGKHYGTKLNVVEHILLARYRKWISHGVKTHLTSNQDRADIENDYTNRVASRLYQMCNVLYLGESASSKDRRE